MSTHIRSLMFGTLVLLLTVGNCICWGGGFNNDPGKVRLQDVQVLTLKHGKMTTGRRSSPVPQLKCVGGSAQGAFNPQVVQCKNVGWDGQDAQWECKSDMDNLYRFGEIEVVCEGYDYAEDPYITKGSCGLEYTLEYTKEGHDRQKRSHDYGYSSSYSNNYGSSYGGYSGKQIGKWSGIGDLIVLAVIGIVIYAMYKTCLTSQEMGDRQYSSTSGDYPAGGGGGAGGWSNPNNRGAGYGPNVHGYNDDASCGTGYQRRNHGTGGGGGFWTGLATGGLMGYMFGGNRGGYYNGYGYRPRYNNYGSTWGTGGGWGGGGGGSSFGGGSSSSSGTRTASGFGGTRRR